MDMNSTGGQLWKAFKTVLLYFFLFFITGWLQTIALAFIFPVGGGEFHMLFQLSGARALMHFLARVYRIYLLVDISAAGILSLIFRSRNVLAIGFVASLLPLINWIRICLLFPLTSPIPFLLASAIPLTSILAVCLFNNLWPSSSR